MSDPIYATVKKKTDQALKQNFEWRWNYCLGQMKNSKIHYIFGKHIYAIIRFVKVHNLLNRTKY